MCMQGNLAARSGPWPCVRMCRGQQPSSPGCYDPNPALTGVETWAWETILTFVLIYVVYATAIASPGHGSLSPLAIGLSVYVATVAGKCHANTSYPRTLHCQPAFLAHARPFNNQDYLTCQPALFALQGGIQAFSDVLRKRVESAVHSTGGNWTGASLNPARVLAGLIVYGCNLHGIWWIYLLGQIVGAILASAVRSLFCHASPCMQRVYFLDELRRAV